MKKVIEEVDGIIDEARRLCEAGKTGESLQYLDWAQEKMKGISGGQRKRLKGCIYHCQGKILQVDEKFCLAVEKFEKACGMRFSGYKDCRKDYAYSFFRLYICKVYANQDISEEETDKTEEILYDLLRNADKYEGDTGKYMGDAYQRLGDISKQKGKMEKAILFYSADEGVRTRIKDKHGLALCWVRLAECFVEFYENDSKKNYKDRALKYANKAKDYFERKRNVPRINQVQKNVFEKLGANH